MRSSVSWVAWSRDKQAIERGYRPATHVPTLDLTSWQSAAEPKATSAGLPC